MKVSRFVFPFLSGVLGALLVLTLAPAQGSFGSRSSVGDFGLQGGRLTLSSATPVPVSDVTAAGTLYWTPYKHSLIALFDGTSWQTVLGVETSESLTSISTTAPTDVFGFLSAGVLDLELLVWTNNTTRATGLTRQNGVWTKTGDATRRYMGTIYGSALNVCEDSAARRFVWNADNRVARSLVASDATDSWTYTTASFREANAGTTLGTSRVAYVAGLAEDPVQALVIAGASNTVGSWACVGIGLDSSTVNSAQARMGSAVNQGGITTTCCASYFGVPGLGYRELRWLELSQVSGTTTWIGDNATTFSQQSGLTAKVLA